MDRPGTKSATCDRLTAPSFAICSGPISWIAIGTFWTSCLRLCAVTVTTCVSEAGSDAAASGAAASGAAACARTPALASAPARAAMASAMEVGWRTGCRCMSVLLGSVVDLAVAGGHGSDPVADQLHALLVHRAAAQLG